MDDTIKLSEHRTKFYSLIEGIMGRELEAFETKAIKTALVAYGATVEAKHVVIEDNFKLKIQNQGEQLWKLQQVINKSK